MDDTMLCHANKINDLFGRPTGRAGCSQISMPRDRLLVRYVCLSSYCLDFMFHLISHRSFFFFLVLHSSMQ